MIYDELFVKYARMERDPALCHDPVIWGQLKRETLEVLGLTDHPKADLLWNMVWETAWPGIETFRSVMESMRQWSALLEPVPKTES